MSVSPVFVIAEAGVNHNGSLEMAMQLVDAAVDAGADAVKFQTFKAEKLVTSIARKADYQQQHTAAGESQLAMLKRLELSDKAHHRLISYCQDQNIEFMSTAFDFESLDFLVDELGLQRLKIASGEITNGPLLLAHARTGRSLILSTGMATLNEIAEALGVIAFGLMDARDIPPSMERFREAYHSAQGKRLLQEKVMLLHCTTEYPAPIDEINLNAMQTMREAFGLPVGYSDHSQGITVSVAATALGARVIEKHFTLDKGLEGPDHQASLEPNEFKAMVAAVRMVVSAMGDGHKKPSASECKNIPVARKSLVAACAIQRGEPFTSQNLTAKRPGIGISPMRLWEILDTKAKQDWAVDAMVCE